jgi:hypothetical protein
MLLRVQRHEAPTLCSAHVPKRENVIVNRLNKTKDERVVDHEAERIERVKGENAAKCAAAAAKVQSVHASLPSLTWNPTEQRKADLELAEARKAEKAARSYDSFLNAEDEDEEEVKPNYSSVKEMEEDFM